MTEIFLKLILPMLIFLPILIAIGVDDDWKDISFNPKCNYKKWDNLNWLGVWCGTIILIIAFYPIIISRVIYNLFHWLFTVGRKK